MSSSNVRVAFRRQRREYRSELLARQQWAARHAERSEVEAIFRSCVQDDAVTLSKKAFILALKAESKTADRMALRAGLETNHAPGERFNVNASTPHGKENIAKALRWFSSGDTKGTGSVDAGEFCTMFGVPPAADAEPPIPVLVRIDAAPPAEQQPPQRARPPTETAVDADAEATSGSSTRPTVYVPSEHTPSRGRPLPPRDIASVASVRAGTDSVHAIFGERGRRREARRKLAAGSAPLAYSALDPGTGHGRGVPATVGSAQLAHATLDPGIEFGRGPPPQPRPDLVQRLKIAAPVALQKHLLRLTRAEAKATTDSDGLLLRHDDDVADAGGCTSAGATAHSSMRQRRKARLEHYTQHRRGAAFFAAKAAARTRRADSRALVDAWTQAAATGVACALSAAIAAAAEAVAASTAAAAAAAAAAASAPATGGESKSDHEVSQWCGEAHREGDCDGAMTRSEAVVGEWRQRKGELQQRDECDDRALLYEAPWAARTVSFLDRPPLEEVYWNSVDINKDNNAIAPAASPDIERAPSPAPSVPPTVTPAPATMPPVPPESPLSPRLTASVALPASSKQPEGVADGADGGRGGGSGGRRFERITGDGRCYAMDELYRAVLAGDAVRTRWMLQRNVPPNCGGGWSPSASLALPGRVSPLHIAAAQNSPAIVEALLAHGATLEARDAFGLTPLAVAAHRNAVGALKVLLVSGANVRALTMEQQLKHPGVVDAIETSARNRAAALATASAQRQRMMVRPLPARRVLGRDQWAEAKVKSQAVALCMALEDVDTMTEALLRGPLRVRAVE